METEKLHVQGVSEQGTENGSVHKWSNKSNKSKRYSEWSRLLFHKYRMIKLRWLKWFGALCLTLLSECAVLMVRTAVSAWGESWLTSFYRWPFVLLYWWQAVLVKKQRDQPSQTWDLPPLQEARWIIAGNCCFSQTSLIRLCSHQYQDGVKVKLKVRCWAAFTLTLTLLEFGKCKTLIIHRKTIFESSLPTFSC